MKRFLVGAADLVTNAAVTTVGAIVAKAGGDARAVADGRVFIGRKRATSDADTVAVGDEVTIAEVAASTPTSAGATTNDVAMIARDGDVVACFKPAGIPTIPDHGGASHALVARVAAMLGVAEASVHPTSRLDRDVSGVVVFALSKEARERLAKAREQNVYVRRYVAIATRAPEPLAGTWSVPIGRAQDPRHRQAFGRNATHAETHFAVVATAGVYALLALAPVTGRTHQLRVHAAHAGAPLVGDRVYSAPVASNAKPPARGARRPNAGGASLTLPTGKVVPFARIALHAAHVIIPRRDGTPWPLRAPIPTELTDLWRLLGGEPSAWDTAVACPLPTLQIPAPSSD